MFTSPVRVMLAVSLAALIVSQHSVLAADGVATVIGRVTLNGKPLAKGKILLHSEAAAPVEMLIADGAFSADKVPLGKKTVTIEGTGIPGKFSARETTELTVEIKAGANEINFELKS